MTWLYHAILCPRCMKPMEEVVEGNRIYLRCPYCGYEDEYMIKYEVVVSSYG